MSLRLNDSETKKVINAADGLAILSAAVGTVTGGMGVKHVALALGLFAAYCKIYGWLMKMSNKGKGVTLTVPWVAILAPPPAPVVMVTVAPQ